ncbi:MAG: DNA alkylation repair protein [Cyclobacteriaceae bacterium]
MSDQTQDYLDVLTQEFALNANAEIALKQKQYMRNQFDFYGMKAGERQQIQKPFLTKEFLPPKSELSELVHTLWSKPQRDFQFFGQELVWKYIKVLEVEDLELLEYMVTHKSWWDTVDYIANRLMGSYFKKHPNEIPHQIDKWLDSGNIWLQRSALLFQLKYKSELNTELLTRIILRLLGSNEFFINKAIGWVLREYSRTNPDWVLEFTNSHELNPLSRREALRLMKH